MEPRSSFVPGADGLPIHVLEWSREGVPLVLLHGFGNDAHIWDDFAPEIAPYYRTIALDLRGHGDSGRDPEGRYDYAYHVRDVEAVTAALGISRMVLIGHSMGGRVSLLFAGAHPERLAGLVIVDLGPDLDPRGSTRIQLDMMRTADATFSSPAEYQMMLLRAYPAARPHALERMVRHGLRQREDGRWERKTDPRYHRASYEKSEAERNESEAELARALWGALARIPCPTLIVRGAASDILSPETADRMVDEVLQEGRLAVVPQAGHSVMTDNPEGFRDAVFDFALG